MRIGRALLACAVACVGLVVGTGVQPAGAAVGTFSNPTAITAGPAPGVANTYPSKITVANLAGKVTNVELVIPSLTSGAPADLDILLVGPAGQKVVVASDISGTSDVSGVNLRFADGAAAPPTPLVSGTYAPTNIDTGVDSYAAPAPAGPYAATFAAFDNSDPNGEWSLFIVDDNVADTQTLANGWQLVITTRIPPCVNPPEDGFTDVDPANVHETNIDCIVAKGVASGTTATTFSPSSNVSRGQMASFVARAMIAADPAIFPGSPPDAFTDDAGSIHELRINQLRSVGVIGLNGEQGSQYFPSTDMRRDHMASFLFEAYEALAGAPLAAGPDAFTDDTGNPHEGAINALAAADVLSGTGGGLYSPSSTVSRGQMGSFLARFLELLSRDGQLPS